MSSGATPLDAESAWSGPPGRSLPTGQSRDISSQVGAPLLRHAAAGLAESARRQVLLDTMLDGMHSLAQPLTYLQGFFHLQRLQAGERITHAGPMLVQEAAGRNPVAAERELERLCSLFHLMQELLHAEASASYAAPASFEDLLKNLAEDADAIFCGFDLELRMVAPEQRESTPCQLYVDEQRTRKAWSAALVAARELLAPGSSLHCSMHIPERAAALVLVLTQASGPIASKAPDDMGRLRLALARACLQGPGGLSGDLQITPFQLRMELQLASASAGNLTKA